VLYIIEAGGILGPLSGLSAVIKLLIVADALKYVTQKTETIQKIG
jgi:hypothetical protein